MQKLGLLVALLLLAGCAWLTKEDPATGQTGLEAAAQGISLVGAVLPKANPAFALVGTIAYGAGQALGFLANLLKKKEAPK
jgi:hypothetical protein